MRLIVHKIYRAFPELDRFSDEQCHEYLAQIRRRFRERHAVLRLAQIVVLLVLTPLTFGVTAAVGELISPTLPAGSRGILVDSMLIYAAFLAVPTAGVPLLLVMTMRNRWFRRRLREHLKEIRCAQCRYLLLGLKVEGGVVTCPECGEQIVLERMGLTPADVMGVEAGAPAGGARLVPAP